MKKYRVKTNNGYIEFLTHQDALTLGDEIEELDLVAYKPDIKAEALEQALSEIQRLESQITPRRMREAVLTEEGATWLANQEALIATERNKLTGE
jgi:hypothetical protein